MGRTHRQRKRKVTTDHPVSLNSNPNFVSLAKWMGNHGWKQTCVLHIVDFMDTGRGLVAGHNIQEGDVLVSIPKCLLVTTATVANSMIGRLMITNTTKTDSFLAQELLAAFLLWEKHLEKASDWAAYISTLPTSFTLPIALSSCHISNFPHFIRDPVLSSLELVQKCYSHLLLFLKFKKCFHCQILAEDIFRWDNFLWSWSCVNTRAVFIEPELVPKHQLILKDRNCLALAPYLDMFNHSDSAEVKVGLNSLNDCYEILSRKPFKKFNEVFINYGPHSNVKLFLEYGFVLPSTVHDTIPIRFNNIVDAFKSAGIKIYHKTKKIQFCQAHGLGNQLYLSDCELSWNCSTILKILLSTSSDMKLWEQISFMSSNLFSLSENELKSVKRNLFGIVKQEIVDTQNLAFLRCNDTCCNKCDVKDNPSLEVCKLLLNQLILIIDSLELDTK